MMLCVCSSVCVAGAERRKIQTLKKKSSRSTDLQISYPKNVSHTSARPKKMKIPIRTRKAGKKEKRGKHPRDSGFFPAHFLRETIHPLAALKSLQLTADCTKHHRPSPTFQTVLIGCRRYHCLLEETETLNDESSTASLLRPKDSEHELILVLHLPARVHLLLRW